MNQTDPSDDQNPYATPSEIHVYPESIEFDGVVTREAYTKLLPKKTLYVGQPTVRIDGLTVGGTA